jgi:hypothetical protein
MRAIENMTVPLGSDTRQIEHGTEALGPHSTASYAATLARMRHAARVPIILVPSEPRARRGACE